MTAQILDKGKTFVAIRIPESELEAARRDIDTRLRKQEYTVIEAPDGNHMILIVFLISTAPGGRRALDRMVEHYGDASSVHAVADNPKIGTAEIDF